MTPQNSGRWTRVFLTNFETILLGMLSISWGLWVGLPFSPIYALATAANPVEATVSTLVIGMLMVLSGVLKLVGIVKPETKLLEIGGALGFLCWTFVFILLVLSNIIVTGTVFYPFFAIWNGWLYLKVRVIDS
jgi:hypothetical protein